MSDCDFCGAFETNGTHIEKDGNGGWRHNTGAVNPVRSDLKFACRKCAEEKING